MSQLLLDDSQTFVDEHGGADGYLVLVLHPVFVVDGYQGIEHVFGTLDANVFQREVDDGGFLVVQRYGQLAGISCRGTLQTGTGDVDRLLAGFRTRHRLDQQPANRCGDGIVEQGFDSLGGFFFATHKVGQLHALAIGNGKEGERSTFVVLQVEELHLVGAGLPVQHLSVESAVGGIVDVQVQTFHHIVHHGRRLQRLHLVVDVGVGLEQIQVAQYACGVGQGVSLAVLLDKQGCRTGIDRRGGEQMQ